MGNKLFKKNIQINELNHSFFCDQKPINYLIENNITVQGFPGKYMRMN